ELWSRRSGHCIVLCWRAVLIFVLVVRIVLLLVFPRVVRRWLGWVAITWRLGWIVIRRGLLKWGVRGRIGSVLRLLCKVRIFSKIWARGRIFIRVICLFVRRWLPGPILRIRFCSMMLLP